MVTHALAVLEDFLRESFGGSGLILGSIENRSNTSVCVCVWFFVAEFSVRYTRVVSLTVPFFLQLCYLLKLPQNFEQPLNVPFLSQMFLHFWSIHSFVILKTFLQLPNWYRIIVGLTLYMYCNLREYICYLNVHHGFKQSPHCCIIYKFVCWCTLFGIASLSYAKWQPTTGFMTNVNCGLTAKKPWSAPCPTLVTKYGTTLLSVRVIKEKKQEHWARESRRRGGWSMGGIFPPPVGKGSGDRAQTKNLAMAHFVAFWALVLMLIYGV